MTYFVKPCSTKSLISFTRLALAVAIALFVLPISNGSADASPAGKSPAEAGTPVGSLLSDVSRLNSSSLIEAASAQSGVVANVQKSGAASAQSSETVLRNIDIVEVSGFIDRTTVLYLNRQLKAAVANDSVAIVLQINSRGSTLSASEFSSLVNDLRGSSLPVVAWVGPTSARLSGGAVRLLDGVDVVGMAPGVKIKAPNQATTIRGSQLSANETIDQAEAKNRNLIQLTSPTLEEFVRDLDGFEAKGGQLSTFDTTARAGLVAPRFVKPSLAGRIFHTATMPAPALFFLTVGILLLMFEFFAAAIGIVGIFGVGCFLLGSFGAGDLGVRPIGIALYVLGVLLMVSDLQSGPARLRAYCGIACFGLAGNFIFTSAQPSVLAQTVIFVPEVIFILMGIPVMIRTRFSTSRLPRESLIGREAVVGVSRSESSHVVMDGARWAARPQFGQQMPTVGTTVAVIEVADHDLIVKPVQ